MSKRKGSSTTWVRRPHRYRAKPTVVDGIRFASQKEAKRYGELKMLEKAGEIAWLCLQPAYPLRVNNSLAPKIGHYVADFSYTETRTGHVVVEDVKGFKTPLYRWKRKHVEAQYGITIKET